MENLEKSQVTLPVRQECPVRSFLGGHPLLRPRFTFLKTESSVFRIQSKGQDRNW